MQDKIVISISGIEEPLTLSGDDIWIKEPNSAKLNANHFTLSSGANNNQIVDDGNNNPHIIDNLIDGKYIWGFVDSIDAPMSAEMFGELAYARLERGNDGVMRLRTTEGSGNDYTMYIRVVYGKLNDGVVLAVQDTIAVKVKGVTYPSDYIWSVTGTGGITLFKYTESIGRNLFGNNLFLTLGLNADIYVLRTMGQSVEFALSAAEPKYYFDNNGVQ